MKRAEQLASFIVEKSYSDISDLARQDLKIRVLDSLGCAVGALGEGPVKIVRAQLEDFGGSEQCTLIGGGRTAPDRASLYNASFGEVLGF